MIQKDYYANMSDKQLNNEYINSCAFGYMEIVEYLLTSPELKKTANIHYQEDIGVIHACAGGCLSIVQYLLMSPNLKEHADIHADNDRALLLACSNSKMNIIEYLIFEYNIKYTSYIENHLIEKNRKDVINMFKIRDLKEDLQRKLNNKTNNNTSIKNKI